MSGQHRAERAKPAVAAWLGAGAVTLGIGAALTTGAAVANAGTEESGGTSSSSGAAQHDTASAPQKHDTTSATQSQDTTSAPKKKPRHRADTKPDTDSTTASAGDENPTRTKQGSTNKRAEAAATAGVTKTDSTPTVQSASTSSTPKVAATAKAAATPTATTAPTNPLAGIIAAVQSWGHAIQVQYFNNKPRIISVSAPTLNSDGSYSGQVVATDKDGDPLIYSVFQPHDGSVVTIDQTGHYTLTPSDYAQTRPTSDAFGVNVVESNADEHYHGFGQIIGQVVQTALHNAFGQLHYPPYNAPDYATVSATVPGVPWGNTDPSAGAKVSAKLTAASAATTTAFTDPLTTFVYGVQGWFNRTFNNTLPAVTISAPTKNADGSYTGQITATDIDGDPLQVNLTPVRNGTITYTDHGDGTYTYTFVPSEAALTTPNSVFSLFVSAVELNANDHFHGLPQIQDFIVQSTLGNFARAVVPSYSYSWPPYDALTWSINGASIRVPIGPAVPPTSA